MKLFSSLPATVLATTATMLSANAQAGPMPTNVATMNAMVEKATTEVRYGRGARLAYRGGLGYRRPGYGVAGAVVAGAVARRAYYGAGYGGYYEPGYPAYGYATGPYGYGGGYGYAPAPYGYDGGGYVVRRYYGW